MTSLQRHTTEGEVVVPAAVPRLGGWMFSTDHKRIATMTLGVALCLFFGMGALAMVMRAQLAQPNQHLISPHTYNELFTIHGSGMIYMVITPLALGMGMYLVPLQLGAPLVAAPRTANVGFWLYAAGAAGMLSGFGVIGGAGSAGWFAYLPLSDAQYTPGHGQDLWLFGVFTSTLGMILMGGCVLWTIAFKRAPNVTLLHMPVFCWAMLASVLMVLAAFPSLLAALTLMAVSRVAPGIFHNNIWNIGYQHLFWFYGHPVVYVMFFPFVGAVAEVLSTFAGRPFAGYKPTVLSLLTFSAFSMAVWGHHMFTTGQVVDTYYQLTSQLLILPAGIEYFGMLGTLIGGKLRFTAAMHFAIAFIPQFLIGGLSGVMVATPIFDYHAQDSYFVVAHFHYTLFAGSVFGFFAGVYFWFPKVTGVMLREGLGKLHFWLLVVGTNVTFMPMFALGILGLPRRVVSYNDLPWYGTLQAISTAGGGIIALAMITFALNVFESLRVPHRAGADPWQGLTLEWATSSPPPPLNFNREWPVPKVESHTPLLDLRLKAAGREDATDHESEDEESNKLNRAKRKGRVPASSGAEGAG